jgi:hypothetical protein
VDKEIAIFYVATDEDFNIIGRKDIFDNFIIAFNEKEKYVEFGEN